MAKKILNVPYVSRYVSESKERLDSGACCVAMLLGAMTQPTSAQDVVAASAGGKKRLSPTALIRGARALGLTLFQDKNRRLDDLMRLIGDGQPPIVALKYGLLADRRERKCTRRRYVLLVGYDDSAGLVYVNDPHYPGAGQDGSGGYQHAYTYQAFVEAWEAADYNILVPVPPAPPEAPADAALSFSLPPTTGEAWVIAPLGLRLRARPEVSAESVAAGVSFGEHLGAIGPESGPDADGYTWQQVLTDQGITAWVAAGCNADRYLAATPPSAPYTVYVLDTQPVSQAGGLGLRKFRDVNAEPTERAAIGDALVAYQRVTEADGAIWLWVKSPRESFGWVREKADGVVLVNSLMPPGGSPGESPGAEEPMARADRYGININPDPHNVHRPLTADELRQGVGWVRFVFMQSDLPDLTEAQSRAHYDAVVEYYRAAGTKSLMILNWQSFKGNFPWWNNGDWSRYANDFGNYVRGVAQHFKGRVAAYQIWNEGDNPDGKDTSVYIRPETYAPILLAAGRAIKEVDPAAKVVFGGVCGSAENNVNYVRQTRAAMHGEWPVDAVGMHPYGQYPVSVLAEVPGLTRFGSLEQYLDIVTRGLSDPIWITEIGVPNDNQSQADDSTYHWEEIARYQQEVYAKVAQCYSAQVPIIFWFAWSNRMRGSGIVDTRNNPKGPIYDTFFKIVRGLA